MRKRFELPCELTIYSAAQTREDLLTWLNRQDTTNPAPLEIGASQVQDIDGAGLQLLGALAQALGKRGLDWSLIDASGPVLDACKTLGSSAWLEGPASSPDCGAAE